MDRTFVAPLRFGGGSGKVGCAGSVRLLVPRRLLNGRRIDECRVEQTMQAVVSVELVEKNRGTLLVVWVRKSRMGFLIGGGILD